MAKFTKAMLLSCLLAVPSIASLYNADTEQFTEDATEQTAGELEMLASGEDATDGESVENDAEDYDEDADEDYDEDDDDGDDKDEEDREEEENDDDEDEDEDINEDDDESPESPEEDFMNRLDKSKDGKLSKDEIFPYGPGPDDLHPEQDPTFDHMFAKFDENLPKLDKDGDKLINHEELPSLLEWMEKEDHLRFFETLDENKDGKLDEQEISKSPEAETPDMAEKIIAHFRKNLKKVDKDGDSMISPEELPGLLASAEEFKMEQEKGMREDVKKPGKNPELLASAAKFVMEQEKGMRKDVKKPGKK